DSGFGLGDFVVGSEDEHGGFRFHPEVGFLAMFGGDVFERFADRFGGVEAAFSGGVVIVGAANDALLGGGNALGFRKLEDPADEIGFRELVVGIGDEDRELLFHRGRFVVFAGF